MRNLEITIATKNPLKPHDQIEDDDVETETITTGDAMKFPLFASGALLSIYLLFRYLDPEYLALFIAAYFVLIGTAGVQFAISPLVTKVLSPLSKNIADKIVISLVDGDKDGGWFLYR